MSRSISAVRVAANKAKSERRCARSMKIRAIKPNPRHAQRATRSPVGDGRVAKAAATSNPAEQTHQPQENTPTASGVGISSPHSGEAYLPHIAAESGKKDTVRAELLICYHRVENRYTKCH